MSVLSYIATLVVSLTETNKHTHSGSVCGSAVDLLKGISKSVGTVTKQNRAYFYLTLIQTFDPGSPLTPLK